MMLRGRALRFLRPRSIFHPQRQSRANFVSTHRQHATQSTTTALPKPQYEPPRKRMTFKDRLRVYFFLSATAQVLIFFVYEPVRDYGLFETISHWTIFPFVPLKKVKPREPLDAGFIHQPITKANEIRLLVLEPGSADDPLECHLVNVQLSWRTKYEALSYTWGDVTKTRPLTCSGHTIPVTFSLHDALTDLRLPRLRRYLWVDAVCINQADNAEKAKQIILMGQIYRGARRVLIYLGRTDPAVDGAIDRLRQLDWTFMPLHIQHYCSRLGVLGPIGVVLMGLLPAMKPIPHNDQDKSDWESIIHLLQRPWFRRTWIIQEAVLARHAHVVCGDKSVPWALLERVVLAMNGYHGGVKPIPGYSEIGEAVRAVALMRSARRDRYRHILMPEMWLVDRYITGSRHEYSKLLDLIQESRAFACTNPRDKIFGMLGLTKEDTEGGYLTPSDEVAPGDVFRKFVLWEVLRNNSLRVLGVSSDKESSEFSSPSWVPDFTKLDPQQTLTRFEKRARYHASLGHPVVQARVSEDGAVLYLKGRLIDKIQTVAQLSVVPTPDGPGTERVKKRRATGLSKDAIQEAIDIWQAAWQRRTNGRAQKFAARDLCVATGQGDIRPYPPHWAPFLRALVCDRTDIGNYATVADLPYLAACVCNAVGRTQQSVVLAKTARLTAGATTQAIVSAGQSRRFASTEMGLAGYVPMRAQVGDLVVVLHGGNVPIVLRPVEGGKLALVGECYLDGLMWGKGSLGIVGVGRKEQEFELV